MLEFLNVLTSNFTIWFGNRYYSLTNLRVRLNMAGLNYKRKGGGNGKRNVYYIVGIDMDSMDS